MLTCRDVTDITTDYLEGALPRTRRLALQFHLSICSFCRRHLRQVRATVRFLRHAPTPAPSPAVENAVLARLAEPPLPQPDHPQGGPPD